MIDKIWVFHAHCTASTSNKRKKIANIEEMSISGYLRCRWECFKRCHAIIVICLFFSRCCFLLAGIHLSLKWNVFNLMSFIPHACELSLHFKFIESTVFYFMKFVETIQAADWYICIRFAITVHRVRCMNKSFDSEMGYISTSFCRRFTQAVAMWNSGYIVPPYQICAKQIYYATVCYAAHYDE